MGVKKRVTPFEVYPQHVLAEEWTLVGKNPFIWAFHEELRAFGEAFSKSFSAGGKLSALLKWAHLSRVSFDLLFCACFSLKMRPKGADIEVKTV
ncbi:hypothetical protein [Thermococcus thioreducens]|uniref:Uncharacterized protein n=1 Tax=Thermococcus thioreducens TaxID=277988 RepID=A0A0Q2M3L6_9EURY|nr:hypothetical protein [Thermococcus thioreducens]ASJ11593.1 hypothetical protein A3L14_01230 [Thermococcus thioreducens]KQH82665.1 hypothetical protein AMR53_05205 [Thermococcus thioreducens]